MKDLVLTLRALRKQPGLTAVDVGALHSSAPNMAWALRPRIRSLAGNTGASSSDF